MIWKSASTLPALTEKRTSTSIPINMNCHNKKQSGVRDQIIHFIQPKQIDGMAFNKSQNKCWIYVPIVKLVSYQLLVC